MRPTAFHDLPAEKFPMTAIIAEVDVDEVLWSESFSGPGALDIPCFGRPVRVLVVFGDGTFEHGKGEMTEETVLRLVQKTGTLVIRRAGSDG